MLAFDITQFFPSLNHQLLSLILNKARFDQRVSLFIFDYLEGRKTQYLWNNFSSLFFNIDAGVEQGLVLSSVLLALYLSPIFHIFEKGAKNLKNLVSLIFLIMVILYYMKNHLKS